MNKPYKINYFKFSFICILLAGLFFSCNTTTSENRQIADFPKVLDDRLELTLFAEDPDIVTPVGIAIDSLNQIFVLESHTHMPEPEYDGPGGDVIKVFHDLNGDGKVDEITEFANGIHQGMNLAFSPDGILYLVTATAVYAFYDHNGDGTSDEKVKVLGFVIPESVYPHASLLGITFSHDGWMYISKGNTGSKEWILEGTDGSSLTGYGDGGNVVRARPDGSELSEIATGFWNAFDLKFDEHGRLLAADNDPDSRGPNRLLHVVPGADFGYISLYGMSGIHPYSAWNGELPGTLPYAVGLGQAPSGLLDAGLASLPEDYRGNMLATIWEENRISRINTSSNGVSISGETETIIEGDKDFRPVAFASDSKGNIYFTDWVLRFYPNHGKGRIWKINTKDGNERMQPRKIYSEPVHDAGLEKLNEIYSSDSPDNLDSLIDYLKSDDPFIQNAAITVLTQPQFQQHIIDLASHDQPEVRLGAIVALNRTGHQDAEEIALDLLTDPNEQVRQRVLMWIGREFMSNLQPHLDLALTSGSVSTELFNTYLSTVRHLRPEFIQAYQNREERYSRNYSRPLPDNFVEDFIRDDSRVPELRAIALKYLDEPKEELNLILSFADHDADLTLQREAILTLAEISDPEVENTLLKVATDSSFSEVVRAESLISLSRQRGNHSEDVLPLFQDPSLDIQIEVVRYLRVKGLNDDAQDILQNRFTSIENETELPLKEQIAMSLQDENITRTMPDRPSTVEEWQNTVANGGDPVRGRRVFYSTHSMCGSCHASEGRGSDFGPDLTNAGQSNSRDRLVHSILRPSDDVSPQWLGWEIRTKDGNRYYGRQIDVGGNNIGIITEREGFIRFDMEDIEDYQMVERSLMPEGLENRLTENDFRDLIAYLMKEK